MTAITPSNLQIDVVSDVVCPWCYIGKRQLDRAIAAWRASSPSSPGPTVQWRPFQLSPEIPVGGVDRKQHMLRKFGDRSLTDIHARLRAIGEPLGISFDFDAIRIQPNTLKAHALIELASGSHQSLLVEALFEAFFVDGRNLADDATLRQLAHAAQVGLSDALIDTVLEDDTVTRIVAAADAEIREYGVSGVPLFVISAGPAERQVISGAQGSDALLAAMRAVGGG